MTSPIDLASHDPELARVLRERRLEPLAILFVNEPKGRITVLVRDAATGARAVVKWCGRTAPRESRSAFANEARFYRSRPPSAVLPALRDADGPLLILDHIEGRTLREWLLEYGRSARDASIEPRFRRLADELGSGLAAFHAAAREPADGVAGRERFVHALLRLYSKLYSSGPMRTSRGWIEARSSTWLGAAGRPVVRRCIARILHDVPSLTVGTTHGDLHANNVLVSERGGVFLIDFERVGEDRFLLVDWLYLCVTARRLLPALPRHGALLTDRLRERLAGVLGSGEAEAFDPLLEVLEQAISLNSRFAREARPGRTVRAHCAFLPRALRSYARVARRSRTRLAPAGAR